MGAQRRVAFGWPDREWKEGRHKCRESSGLGRGKIYPRRQTIWLIVLVVVHDALVSSIILGLYVFWLSYSRIAHPCSLIIFYKTHRVIIANILQLLYSMAKTIYIATVLSGTIFLFWPFWSSSHFGWSYVAQDGRSASRIDLERIKK